MPLVDESGGRHHLAWRAVSALKRVVLGESALDGVERVAIGETLDRPDRSAFQTDGEHEAGDDAMAVEMDGAGAAGAHGATLLGAGELDMVAQRVETTASRLVLS